jgi:protoheme IX farnesyltransferase
MLVVLLATAGIVGAANAFNCYIERDIDRFMARTRNRPLPAGRMDPAVALWFGISLSVVSVPALGLGANWLTCALGLLALLSYVLVYTPMKGRSWAAMLVGAIPGALPPMMGWTAVTGRLELPSIVLFAILFLWQIPHFIAIALFRKEEYAAAGLKSLPIEKGDDISRTQIVLYLAALLPISLMPYFLGVAGLGYFAIALILGAAFLGLGAWGFWKRLGKKWARQLFFASIVYLTGLFIGLMVNGGGQI